MSERIPRLVEPQIGVKKWGRNLAALAVLSASASVPLLAVSPAKTECGPHKCTVSLSADGFVEVDPGFIGPARLPLETTVDIPVIGEATPPLGARLKINEIPSSSAAAQKSAEFITSDEGLTEAEVRELAQLYSGAFDDSSEILDDVRNKLVGLSMASAVGLIALYNLVGTKRRQELVDAIRQPQTWAAPAIFSLLLASPLPVEARVEQTSTWQSTSTLFDNTPLEGLETKGEIWKHSIYGIKQVIDYQQEIRDYYKSAAQNATLAISQNQEFGDLHNRYSDHIVVIRTSDEHCNMGMNEVLAKTAKATDSDIWLSTGDMVIGHTPLDPICVQQISKNMPQKRIITPGNHDPASLTPTLQEAGFLIADGTVQELGGLQFLGLPDPNTSPFANTTQYDAHLTRVLGTKLAAVACMQKQPPVLIGHSSEMVAPAIAAGCADYGFSGHTHSKSQIKVPRRFTNTTGFIDVLGTSGGAKNGALSIEELRSPATVAFDIYAADDVSEQPVLKETWILTVSPDQTVTFKRTEDVLAN